MAQNVPCAASATSYFDIHILHPAIRLDMFYETNRNGVSNSANTGSFEAC